MMSVRNQIGNRQEVTPTRYDCSRLLRYAHNAEADFTAFLHQRQRRRRKKVTNNRSFANHDPYDKTQPESFRHPDPPKIQLYNLRNDETAGEDGDTQRSSTASVIVAYTHHTVSAQLVSALGSTIDDSFTPIEVCMLVPSDSEDDDDNLDMVQNIESRIGNDTMEEQITCLAIVELENLSLIYHKESNRSNNNNDTSKSFDDDDDDEVIILDDKPNNQDYENNRITPVLLTGSFSGSFFCATENKQHRLACVFGTNKGRLLTVEIKITYDKSKSGNPWVMERVSATGITALSAELGTADTLFQVLPPSLNSSSEIDSQKHGKINRMKDGAKKRSGTFSSPIRSANQNTPMSSTVNPLFQSGEVTSISSYRIVDQQHNLRSYRTSIYVWTAFHDGTIIRLHSASFFPSVWEKAANNRESVEDFLCRRTRSVSSAALYSRVRLPPATFQSNGITPVVIPLPQYFPSPLVLPYPTLGDGDLVDASFMDGTYEDDDSDQSSEAFGRSANHIVATTPIVEAFVFGQGVASDVFPTMCFYTSEHQFRHSGYDIQTKAADSVVVSSERYVIGSVTKAFLGSAIGAFRWGFGTTTSKNQPADKMHSMDETVVSVDMHDSFCVDDDKQSSLFPTLSMSPVDLFASIELHDVPRQIEYCSIDPDGNLAAVTDGLGRVILIDIESRQIIRMWKGFRNARCYWHQTTDVLHPGRISLHLLIHSRQRNTIEIWKVRHGSRLLSRQVGKDACVISCRSKLNGFEVTSCYIIQSRVSGPSTNYLEKIELHVESPGINVNHMEGLNTSIGNASMTTSPLSKPLGSTPFNSRSAALRLQRLQQLLSATNVEFTREDVETALNDITSLTDLSTALDLLSRGTALEERRIIVGSELQKRAVVYCREILQKSLNDADMDISKGRNENPHIRLLSSKIQYHTQIIDAYDALHKFQTEKMKDVIYQQAKSPSHWAAESMAWATTYEQVTGLNLDTGLPNLPGEKQLHFTVFASGCTNPTDESELPSQEKSRIYFNDSSRTRREILEHVFEPLLSDVFSFSTVYTILDHLGIREDDEYIQKCFGEWFMTLPLREAYGKGLYSENPPMLRILNDLTQRETESRRFQPGKILLGTIHNICEDTSDLVRAFILASLCREAVAAVVVKKEKATYGKVQSNKLTKDWTSLLRKLRVSLLVSLRLHGKRLAAPITINNVKEDGLFSVFEWLALDELQMTHDHLQIVSLEKACAMSSYSFDPSLPDGDGPTRFKMLQNSCLSAAYSEEEREEYLIDFEDDDRFGALLLFLSSHNIPPMLAAHRALLLAAQWSAAPANIDCLKDGVVALKSLHMTPGLEALAAGVCLEIWQTRICPFYRAHLFGFDDVHELTEDVVAPLLRNKEWLTDVGRVALELLAMLKDFNPEENPFDVFDKILASKDKKTWPPLRHDRLLRKLVEKTKPIHASALDAHSVVVCALLLSGETESLVQCVPTIYDCFLQQSLFTTIPTTSNVRELQKEYLDNAVFALARDYSGPAMDSFDLGEIHTLSRVWSFDSKSIYTLFLLSMYEYGKDRIVDELLTKAYSRILVHTFVETGVDIACRRLNVFLHGKRMNTSGMLDVMSLLDAGMCEWVKRRALESKSLVDNPDLTGPIGHTHLFIMRLLSLSSTSNVDSALRLKIHSLVVLSGILVKALSSNSSVR